METRESGSVTTVSCGTRAGPLSDKSHKSISCIQSGKKRVRRTFESGSLKNHCSLLPAGSSSVPSANAIPESQLPQRGCLSEGGPAASLPRKFSELVCHGNSAFRPYNRWNAPLPSNYERATSSNCLWLFKRLLWHLKRCPFNRRVDRDDVVPTHNGCVEKRSLQENEQN